MDKVSLRTLLIAALVVMCLLAVLSWRSACTAADNAKHEARTENATGEALDRVATETPVIRQEQQEKEDEVDTIRGADDRLPDGFGADLERVRRGGERRNP